MPYKSICSCICQPCRLIFTYIDGIAIPPYFISLFRQTIPAHTFRNKIFIFKLWKWIFFSKALFYIPLPYPPINFIKISVRISYLNILLPPKPFRTLPTIFPSEYSLSPDTAAISSQYSAFFCPFLSPFEYCQREDNHHCQQ